MHNVWDNKTCSGLHETRLITNFRYRAIHNKDKQLYPTALKSGIGGNLIKYDYNSDTHAILMTEAPPREAIDTWLDEMIGNNISVYVTLTNDYSEPDIAEELNDMDINKLNTYRNGEPVNLHHAENISKYTKKYRIDNLKNVDNNSNFEVWSYVLTTPEGIEHEICHIKLKGLLDAVGILEMPEKQVLETFVFLSEVILKYAKNMNVAFNCFMGVGRARFAVFAFFYYISKKLKMPPEITQKTIDTIINNTVSYPYNLNAIGAQFMKNVSLMLI